MYCPQCGTESTSDLKYCRSCGANLKVIGKAVSLSEAIARSDGVPAKVKEMMSNIKIGRVTDSVANALDRMNKEIASSARDPTRHGAWWLAATREKTPERRREREIVKGTVSLFWGTGLTIFLYFLSHALVLKLPPDVVAKIPFELDPVIHVIWLLGLVPALSGLGRIIAGLTIRSGPAKGIESPQGSPLRIDRGIDQEASGSVGQPDELTVASAREPPDSITDRTTNILERKAKLRPTNEIKE